MAELCLCSLLFCLSNFAVPTVIFQRLVLKTKMGIPALCVFFFSLPCFGWLVHVLLAKQYQESRQGNKKT